MDINEDKAENTPAGGVLMGKKDGQTIIHDKGTMSGYLVGKLHKDGGIKAVNKATGQPLEMQGGEVIITAPAVSDQTKREFEGKMMTNREILSAINEKGGGVSFANGGDIPAKINTTDCEYKLGGKVVKDTDIAHSLGMNSTLKKGKQQFSSGDTTYDVDAIYNAIKKGKLRLKTKEVETFPMKYPVYDKKYSETVKTDFRKPNGITVRTESGEEVLIDGNHRMNNAYLKGKKTMKTYYIEDPKQIAKFTKKNKFIVGGRTIWSFDNPKEAIEYIDKDVVGKAVGIYTGGKLKEGGHLSSGKSLKQIAEMHNVSLAHINEQLAKGLEVEKEHFTDFKERTRVAKDHLVENPNYYTILEKAGLKDGGHLIHHRHINNLVKDAKSGNTPARDLNNYNDVMDLEADGMVGMESGLAFSDGGQVNDDLWQSVKDKFSEVFWEEEEGDEIYANEVKAEERVWIFDRYSPYKAQVGWEDAKNMFLKSLTDKEKKIINIEYNLREVSEAFGLMWEKKILVKRKNKLEEIDNLSDLLKFVETGSYADGGITPIDANIEGDSVDIVESDFAKGGVVYDTTKPKIEKVTIKDTYDDRVSIIGRNASNVSELQQILSDYLRNSPESWDWIKFYVNDNTRGSYEIKFIKGQKNTVKNINPETLNSLNFRRVIDAKDYLVKNYDWTDFFELGSQTPTTTTTTTSNASSSGKPYEIKKVSVKWNNNLETYYSGKELIEALRNIERENNGQNVVYEVTGYGYDSDGRLVWGVPVEVETDDTSFVRRNYSDQDIKSKIENWLDAFETDKFFSINQATASVPTSTKPFDFSMAKIDVSNNPELSVKVQKKAFEDGWEWENGGGKTIDYNYFNYLYFTKTSVSYGNNPKSFINSPKREITESDIFGSQATTTDNEVSEISVGYVNDSTGNSGAKRKYSIKQLYDFLKILYDDYDKFSSVSILPMGKNFHGADLTYISIYYDFWRNILGDLSEDDAKDAISKFLITSYPELNFDDYSGLKKMSSTVVQNVRIEPYDAYRIVLNWKDKSGKDVVDTMDIFSGASGKFFIEKLNEIEAQSQGKDVEVRITVFGDDDKGNQFDRNDYFTIGENWFKPSTRTNEQIKSVTEEWIDGVNFDKFFEDVIPLGGSQTPTSQYKPIDLSDTKIWIGDDEEVNKQIQERAFELGWGWGNSIRKEVAQTGSSAIFFESNKEIQVSYNRSTFDNETGYKEITFKDLFEKIEPASILQTPTLSGASGSLEEITDFKEAVGVLEGIASQASQKYNTKKYDENLQLLKDVKEEYELALSFTPESSFMYERIELMKKITEIQKEITRITELKNGGAFYILSKVIDRLERGENWKELGKGEIMVNEVPQEEIDTVIYTENFKNWFGDWEKALVTKEYDYVSKVLTESGKPCVMYHGAKRIKYSYRQVSNGVLYLAENRSYAEWFSATDSPYQKQGDYLTQCFVNVKNPIDLTPFGVEEVDLRDIIQYIDTLYPLAKIYDVLPPNVAMAIMNNQLIGRNFRAWYIIRQFPELNQHIRDNTTYDGFIYYENNPSDMIINESGEMVENVTKATAVFNSNQVKLVDAMLFDGSLDDWRFEKGGKVN